MSVVLPSFPGPARARFSYLDYSVRQKGGPADVGPTYGRLGNRYRLDVTMPAMRLEPEPGWGVGGRVWLSRLRRGLSEGVIFPWPQLGFNIGAPGDPVVRVAQAANTASLQIEGARPQYIFREGQFFNVVVGGRHYLASVRDEAVVGNDGRVTLALGELLRIAVPAATVLRMDPVIEGPLEAKEGQDFEHDTSAIVEPAFAVVEYGYGENV